MAKEWWASTNQFMQLISWELMSNDKCRTLIDLWKTHCSDHSCM
jgi:hypothetical protein